LWQLAIFVEPSTNALQYWVTQQRLLRYANRILGSVDVVLAREDADMTILDAVYGLRNFYKDQCKLDEAEDMYEQALQGYTRCFGSNHSYCHSVSRDLATLSDRVAS
jgi:hypothetical protein